MYEIQWFKVDVNIFANRKIQLLLKQKDGDTYFRVWMQLISLSLKCNNKGKLLLGENTPMTIQDFSKIMGKSAKKMEKIFEELLKFEMIVKDGKTFRIKNWDKYQSIEKFEKYQEQNRIRQQKYREKLKSENEKNNVTVTTCNSTEEKIIENNKEEKEEDNDFREYKI